MNWETVIYNSISIKNNIVLQDPYENNLRKILNFGHTYGHAIESYYLEKNNPILHGEAVMMGMILLLQPRKLYVSGVTCYLDTKHNAYFDNYFISNYVEKKKDY